VRRLAFLAVAAVLAAPARADLRLLDEDLHLGALDARASALVLAASAEPPPMDFDLLGEPEKPPPAAADATLRRRRRLLAAHQAAGIALVGVQVATTAVGTLNYFDKFHGGPNTERYRTAHAVLAYTDVALFVATGALAYLAPSPPGKQSTGVDRVTVHKSAMVAAALGMATQVALGIYTSSREGFDNQQRVATVHLAVGYATLAAVLVGVGAFVL
jgi:hypothetical protein